MAGRGGGGQGVNKEGESKQIIATEQETLFWRGGHSHDTVHYSVE